ncbi:MAG TPA: FHA domain-containing protein [Spirochaetota bacterium]|nr:FHA domain-containing protein [Spirochaetota bacterium]HOL56049.1 FHA domain-containing protein [Spirochaetota bacterium]HPP03195.1 FHA domain-containing protein [Spirochaetota bacterium]
MAKNFFTEETSKFSKNDSCETEKNAKIDVKKGIPRLIVNGQSKELSNKAFGIGRDKSNQLIIADPTVSKFHAIITFENGNAYIKDTDSSNGTFINDKQIPPGKKILLHNNDRIKMGRTVIVFQI